MGYPESLPWKDVTLLNIELKLFQQREEVYLMSSAGKVESPVPVRFVYRRGRTPQWVIFFHLGAQLNTLEPMLCRMSFCNESTVLVNNFSGKDLKYPPMITNCLGKLWTDSSTQLHIIICWTVILNKPGFLVLQSWKRSHLSDFVSEFFQGLFNLFTFIILSQISISLKFTYWIHINRVNN